MSHEIYQKDINLGIFCDLKDHLNNFPLHFINEEMETYTGFWLSQSNAVIGNSKVCKAGPLPHALFNIP